MDRAWKRFERDIASLFNTTRRLMKGTDEKSDIGDDDFPILLDCKLRKKENWSIGGWLNAVEEAAIQEGNNRYPVICLREPGKQRRYAVVRKGPFMHFIARRTRNFTADQFYNWNGAIMSKLPYLKQWDKMIKECAKDKRSGKVPPDAMPMLFINNRKTGDVVFLKPEDLVRIFKDGGLLKDKSS